MGKIAPSQIFLWVLVIIYIFLMLLLFCGHLRFETYIERAGRKTTLHGPLMEFAVALMGLAMLLFRIFRGARTRVIKYVHLGFQTVVMLLLLVGWLLAMVHGLSRGGVALAKREDNKTAEAGGRKRRQDTPDKPEAKVETVHVASTVHLTLGYMMLFIILIHFVVAVFVFAYLYPKSRMRRNFAPFHDIMGIWLFLGMVACYLTGLMYLYDSEIGCCGTDDARTYLHYLTVPSYLGFVIVFVGVLSPSFEWELVGPF